MRDKDIELVSSFLKEFQDETERGAALVGAAMIDQKLLDTLRSFMVKGKITKDVLEGGTAPLGTFSSRIKACYALGLIDEHERSECDLIRKVRNEFAHSIHGLSFSDKKISDFCDKLQSDLPGGKGAFKNNPRGIFVNAVVLILLRLFYRSEWVASERRTIKKWP